MQTNTNGKARKITDPASRQAISLYPEATDTTSSVLSQAEAPKIMQQLGHLGFTPVQARNAVSFLSQRSPIASNLLGSLSVLEASIEYLILYIPECDMPQRFLPTVNSSNPFIASTHSGADDVKKRWVENKAVKEAGWPTHVVKECTSDSRLLDSWDLLIAALGKRLIGDDWKELLETSIEGLEPYRFDPEEVEALGAHFADQTEIVMPLFSAPMKLHILVSSKNSYPRRDLTPLYITSASVPAYVRLYLLAQILRAIKDDCFVEPGEGFCMAAMRFLEGEWANIEDNGPPDMTTVLQHIVPPPQTSSKLNDNESLDQGLSIDLGRRRNGRPRPRDNRSDSQIREDFEALRRIDKVCRSLLTSLWSSIHGGVSSMRNYLQPGENYLHSPPRKIF